MKKPPVVRMEYVVTMAVVVVAMMVVMKAFQITLSASGMSGYCVKGGKYYGNRKGSEPNVIAGSGSSSPRPDAQ
jgi:hypothetical protein